MPAQKTRFLLEIEEQPRALCDAVEYYRNEGGDLLEQASALCQCKHGGRLVLTGMGTSYCVATTLRNLLAAAHRPLPLIFEAGELLHGGLGGIQSNDVLIAISQSGESYETVKVAEKLVGRTILAITNEPNSALAQAATLSLPLCAGYEETISCKSYTNTLAVLLLLAGEIIETSKGLVCGDLLRCAAQMAEFLTDRKDEARAGADFLAKAQFLYFISRGTTMTAAQQAALTWNEGVHMPTSALSGGSFRHGPYELVRPGFHAVFYIPKGETGTLLAVMAREVVALGGRVLAFSGHPMKASDDLFVIEIEPGEDYLLSIAAALPQELLLLHMAEARGLVAGRFEHGSKVTRRE